MNRRRFLKYAGATAGVIGASALGLDYVLRTPSAVPNQTSTVSVSSTVAPTTTSFHTTDMKLTLFADWHGDGVQQSDEPAINNIPVEVTGLDNDYSSVLMAESDGTYWARNIPVGKQYRIVPKSDNFSYVAISNSQFAQINDYNQVVGSDEPSLHLGLMEGFLTFPIKSSTKYTMMNWYDWDPAQAAYLWWNEQSGNEADRHGSPNHTGIDYKADIGEDVIAPAPGITTGEETASTGQISTGIYHGDMSINGVKGKFYTSFNHLSRVLKSEGEGVSRGEKIAEIGSTGPEGTVPHLHNNTVFEMADERGFLDFYQPVFPLSPNHEGYWIAQDDWSRVSPSNNPNGTNFWTRLNTPVFFQ